MWQLDRYESHQKQGLDALEQRDWRMGRFHLLKAGEYLLEAAKVSGPDFQERRRQKARKLLNLAKQCEDKFREANPDVGDPEEGRGTYAGSGSEAGSSGRSSKGDDKHITQFTPLEPSSLTLGDVIGLEEAKRQIRLKALYPMEHPELIKQYRSESGGGILLYGPPGTGKTMLAGAVANEVDAPFYVVRPSDILAPLVGVAERNIAKLFETLRSHPRAVVFFDELDALLPRRDASGESNVMGRIVPQFLQELQGIKSGKKKKEEADQTENGAEAPGEARPEEEEATFLLVLAATNAPWSIDPAVLRPGRFDERIYVELPNPEARRLLLEMYSKGRPLAEDIDFERLATTTDGFSGADLRDLCNDAAEGVLERAIETGEVLPISMSDFARVLLSAKPSVRQADLKRYKEYDEER